jgi:protein-S-isoprenylcysteine O-methyltransferase Ste14
MTSSQCVVKPVLNTLLFTILVPATAAGWIPLWLRGNASMTDMVALRGVSILLIAVGVAIYLHSAFWGFALHGLGTPAPIAPTKKLVVVGLHRYVRNPMYIGVALMVLGQAMLFWSWHLLGYAVLFLIIVHLFVVFYEEPTLERQFGQEYGDYRKRVPRWIPRFRQ